MLSPADSRAGTSSLMTATLPPDHLDQRHRGTPPVARHSSWPGRTPEPAGSRPRYGLRKVATLEPIPRETVIEAIAASTATDPQTKETASRDSVLRTPRPAGHHRPYRGDLGNRHRGLQPGTAARHAASEGGRASVGRPAARAATRSAAGSRTGGRYRPGHPARRAQCARGGQRGGTRRREGPHPELLTPGPGGRRPLSHRPGSHRPGSRSNHARRAPAKGALPPQFHSLPTRPVDKAGPRWLHEHVRGSAPTPLAPDVAPGRRRFRVGRCHPTPAPSHEPHIRTVQHPHAALPHEPHHRPVGLVRHVIRRSGTTTGTTRRPPHRRTIRCDCSPFPAPSTDR